MQAERKAGELLAELERGAGGDRKSAQYQKYQPGTFDPSEYRQVLTANDLAPMTAHRWQRIAAMPEDAWRGKSGYSVSRAAGGALILTQLDGRKRRGEP